MVHKEVIGYPSVTQLINILEKQGLNRWYAKNGWDECERIKKESGLFGTHVHELIESFLLKEKNETQYVPEEMACFDSFKEWYAKFGLVPISLEPKETVKSKLGFQGTWDFIGKKDGRILVVDWKTTGAHYDTVGLQLAAYAQLYGESQGWTSKETFARIPNGLAVRIDKKTTEIDPKEYTGLVYYFDVFQSLLLPYQFVSHSGAWQKPEKEKV